VQDAAWAVCADGSTFPAGGYRIGQAPVAVAANWTPNTFTDPEGSFFLPDGRRAQLGLRPGFHALQAGDAGSAAGTTAWILAPNTSPDCIVMPIIKAAWSPTSVTSRSRVRSLPRPAIRPG
jgi:hypothetical protein